MLIYEISSLKRHHLLPKAKTQSCCLDFFTILSLALCTFQRFFLNLYVCPTQPFIKKRDIISNFLRFLYFYISKLLDIRTLAGAQSCLEFVQNI